MCHVRDRVVTLGEEQGHQTEKRLYIYRPFVGLSSQQMRWALPEQFLIYNKTFMIFVIKKIR